MGADSRRPSFEIRRRSFDSYGTPGGQINSVKNLKRKSLFANKSSSGNNLQPIVNQIKEDDYSAVFEKLAEASPLKQNIDEYTMMKKSGLSKFYRLFYSFIYSGVQ